MKQEYLPRDPPCDVAFMRSDLNKEVTGRSMPLYRGWRWVAGMPAKVLNPVRLNLSGVYSVITSVEIVKYQYFNLQVFLLHSLN